MTQIGCYKCLACIPAPYYLKRWDRTDLCVVCAQTEFDKAQDALRWRKWPEEKPTARGRYLVITDGECSEWPIAALCSGAELSDTWIVDGDRVTHWRPLGLLPEAE